jgi:hypothetical protein
MIIKSWEDYKNFAFSNLNEFKDKDEDILFLDLFENVGKLFSNLKKEIILGDSDNIKKELIDVIGDLLWSSAVIEAQYDLMPSRASNSLSSEVTPIDGYVMTMDLLLLQADFSAILADLMDSTVEKDYDTMQYSINRLMSSLLNLALYKDISLRDGIVASCKKMSVKNKGVTKTKDFNKEYEEAKKDIKKSKSKEVTIDLLKEKLNENQFTYAGVKVKNGRKIFKFETGDLILDFFNASNHVAKELPNQDYNLLYTPEFRAVLQNLIETNSIISAYLYEGKLVNASSIKKDPNKPDVFADKTKYRPVLIKPDMTELDHLLTYISDTKKIKAKKL